MNLVMRTLSFAVLVLVVACNNDPVEARFDVYVEITNTEVYEYFIGDLGDEESVSITKQALHFEISDIFRVYSPSFGWGYRYKAESGFVGIEEVTLRLEQGSDGGSPNTDFTDITFEITVTD